jgi:PhoD-like phosphatase
MVGDQIYADDFKSIDPDDHLDEFLERYRIAFGQPFMRKLMSRVPTYMILDDHEIKDAWSMDMRPGREGLYGAAMSAYQSYQVIHGPAFVPEGPDDVSRTPTRYWYDYAVGPARVFVLDARNERYVGLAGAPPQIISPVQMDALLRWLGDVPAKAAKFVVSSVPVFPDDRSEIGDKWAGFPAQRIQLLEEIRRRSVRKVVFLSGAALSERSRLPRVLGHLVALLLPRTASGAGGALRPRRHHREPAPRLPHQRPRERPRRGQLHAREPRRRRHDHDRGDLRPQGRAAGEGRPAPLEPPISRRGPRPGGRAASGSSRSGECCSPR